MTLAEFEHWYYNEAPRDPDTNMVPQIEILISDGYMQFRWEDTIVPHIGDDDWPTALQNLVDWIKGNKQ